MALLHREPLSDLARDLDPVLPAPPVAVDPVPDVSGPGAASPSTDTAAALPSDGVQPSDGGAAVRRSRLIGATVAAVLALGLGGGTAVAMEVQRNAHEAAAVAAAGRVADARAAGFVELQQAQTEILAARFEADQPRVLAERAAAVTAAAAVVDVARGVLAASPQAAPEPRAALQAAIDTAATALAATPATAVMPAQKAVAPIAAPQQAVVESQAAWQAAEDARIAAEAAAAAEAQAQAAAARATAQARASQPASRSAAKTAAPSTRRAASPAPSTGGGAAAPAPEPEPAASGVPEFSAGALGAAINAYRASNGLPALSVSRSGSLVAHAAAMAQAGSIWHSGGDKIVGYTMPGTASRLVSAWAASPAHNAWMLRTDTTSMQVGAALLNNSLYGAVNFS